jgi:L-ascorbate metabolism protein UlaG (beta-lactamase superfamily)
VIEYHGIKVFFGGDSAYDQRLFVEIAQRFPGIDLALLAIGPIEPREIMRRFHTDPHEALQAFFDLGAKRMVPIHYDTFVNSTDNPGDALRDLAAAKKKWDLGDRQVVPVAIGERRIFLKKGEGPSLDADKAKDESSWSKPATPAPAPTGKPPEKPRDRKDDIPDDEKLD